MSTEGITHVELRESHGTQSLIVQGGREQLRALARQVDGTGSWLVWSNQRGMWWRANWSGYTQFIEEAGRYSHAEATAIVAQATVGGLLAHARTNPVTGEEYTGYGEVMVLAPAAERLRTEAGTGRLAGLSSIAGAGVCTCPGVDGVHVEGVGGCRG